MPYALSFVLSLSWTAVTYVTTSSKQHVLELGNMLRLRTSAWQALWLVLYLEMLSYSLDLASNDKEITE
jgi:hypothetical protein